MCRSKNALYQLKLWSILSRVVPICASWMWSLFYQRFRIEKNRFLSWEAYHRALKMVTCRYFIGKIGWRKVGRVKPEKETWLQFQMGERGKSKTRLDPSTFRIHHKIPIRQKSGEIDFDLQTQIFAPSPPLSTCTRAIFGVDASVKKSPSSRWDLIETHIFEKCKVKTVRFRKVQEWNERKKGENEKNTWQCFRGRIQTGFSENTKNSSCQRISKRSKHQGSSFSLPEKWFYHAPRRLPSQFGLRRMNG